MDRERIGVHRRGRKPDLALREIQAGLAKAGVFAGIGTLWRFLDRRRMTRKKTRPAKLAVVER